MRVINNKKTILVLFLLIIVTSLFINIGSFLVVDDPLQEADAIVVLMGSIPDRIIHASDLNKEGYSSQILMAEEFHSNLLKAHNIKTKVGASINRAIAIELGVKEEAVHIIEGHTESTQDEAVAFKSFFNSHNEIDSIILVTSKYHSKRAKTIFSKAMPDMKIISSPTPYDDYNGHRWWQSREDIASVLMESLKFINYYFVDQFKL